MKSNVDYLNLEYVLVRLQEVFSSIHLFSSGAPSVFVSIITIVYIVGMIASLIFLILIVYSQIQLLHTEHAGFHALQGHGHSGAHADEEVHHNEDGTAVVLEQPKNARFERIMELAASGSQSEWRRAVLEADIMLADELSNAGYRGSSVGEQLKMANPIQLTTLDLAWKAHKVRNEIAHGGESYMLGERDTKVAIDYYKRVFEELGAI